MLFKEVKKGRSGDRRSQAVAWLLVIAGMVLFCLGGPGCGTLQDGAGRATGVPGADSDGADVDVGAPGSAAEIHAEHAAAHGPNWRDWPAEARRELEEAIEREEGRRKKEEGGRKKDEAGRAGATGNAQRPTLNLELGTLNLEGGAR